MLSALSMSAQTITEDYGADKLRQEIGLDYSMPDYSTGKIDPKVIGSRLAKMLTTLERKCSDYVYSQRLSSILCDQIEGLHYVEVEKFSVSKIEKVGDVITITANTKLGHNPAKLTKAEMVFEFDHGLSDSSSVSSLFAELGRYIKE